VSYESGGRVWAEVIDWGTPPDGSAVQLGTTGEPEERRRRAGGDAVSTMNGIALHP
jgi:hypothetical protein